MYSHMANQFGDASNRYIGAAGHFGESAEGWVKNNKFTYLTARTKDELDQALNILVRASDNPILLEVCTTMKDDSDALLAIVEANKHSPQSEKIVQAIKNSIPPAIKQRIKKAMGR
jgi:2-succinyl-5-enolpyruvyl-6-hydroxy-3-cyclohexene-1-carboxylate synthase